LGIDTWIAFFKNISYVSSILKNDSIIWDRMVTIFALVRLQGGSVWLAMVLQLIVTGATIIFVSLVWRRGYSIPVRSSVLVLGTFLCSPYAFEYDLTLLLLPLAWFAVENFQENWLTGKGVLFGLLWYSPVLNKVTVAIAGVPIAPLVIAIFMLSMIRPSGQFSPKPG
jgi:hypothetical protein